MDEQEKTTGNLPDSPAKELSDLSEMPTPLGIIPQNYPAPLSDTIDAVRRVVEMYRECGLIADHEARCKKAADVLDKLVEKAV